MYRDLALFDIVVLRLLHGLILLLLIIHIDIVIAEVLKCLLERSPRITLIDFTLFELYVGVVYFLSFLGTRWFIKR